MISEDRLTGKGQEHTTERLPCVGFLSDKIVPRKVRREGFQDRSVLADQILLVARVALSTSAPQRFGARGLRICQTQCLAKTRL